MSARLWQTLARHCWALLGTARFDFSSSSESWKTLKHGRRVVLYHASVQPRTAHFADQTSGLRRCLCDRSIPAYWRRCDRDPMRHFQYYPAQQPRAVWYYSALEDPVKWVRATSLVEDLLITTGEREKNYSRMLVNMIKRGSGLCCAVKPRRQRPFFPLLLHRNSTGRRPGTTTRLRGRPQPSTSVPLTAQATPDGPFTAWRTGSSHVEGQKGSRQMRRLFFNTQSRISRPRGYVPAHGSQLQSVAGGPG